MKPKTVAIDFDGVIHAHRAAWTYPEQINDGPIPGAFEFIERALEEFNVVIFSARARSPQAREAICAWLAAHWPTVKAVSRRGLGVHVGGGTDGAWVEVTSEKPHAFIYIDDRGWHFRGTFPTMEELRAFDSWTKSKGEPSHEAVMVKAPPTFVQPAPSNIEPVVFSNPPAPEYDEYEIGLGNPLGRGGPEE